MSAPVKIGDQRNFTGDVEESKTGLAGQILDSDGQPVAERQGARLRSRADV